MKKIMKFAEYAAPCGRLLLGVHGGAICVCDWMKEDRTEKTLGRIQRFLPSLRNGDDEGLLLRTAESLDEYFAGKRREIEIPLTACGTRFQHRIWDALRHVPYGSTVSYSSVAGYVGLPGGVRAVANAVGANPLSILIPCHRVVGADGSLTGYAGGLEAKRFLLDLEREYSTIFD